MEGITQLKEPRTFEEQIQILKSRNMEIENEERAIEILKRTNYYRLTAYALQFKHNDEYKDITFDKMYKLYKFDMKLRHLILAVLENIEISLRTYVAYNLSIKYGAEAHKKEELFKDIDLYKGYYDEDNKYHNGLLDEIKSEQIKKKMNLLLSIILKHMKGNFQYGRLLNCFLLECCQKCIRI